ncbi:hypothetical protein C0995_002120, partial [Termitomyces sp. Mi166
MPAKLTKLLQGQHQFLLSNLTHYKDLTEPGLTLTLAHQSPMLQVNLHPETRKFSKATMAKKSSNTVNNKDVLTCTTSKSDKAKEKKRAKTVHFSDEVQESTLPADTSAPNINIEHNIPKFQIINAET